MSERTFGVEIECGHPTKEYMDVLSALKREGFPARLGSARDGAYGVGSDGSGIEVRTRVFQGKKGFSELEKVLDFLFDFGCFVTRRDGMHVHIGAEELLEDKEACRVLARTWYNNQAVIARMCSQHRLNSFSCNSLDPNVIDKLGNKKYVHVAYYQNEQFAKEWGMRRRGLNFTSLPEHGTVEIRLHEGCLDAGKAIPWIKFCQALVDYSVSERKVLKCARSKSALLDAVGVPEEARAKLWRRQPQMPLTGRRVRHRAKK